MEKENEREEKAMKEIGRSEKKLMMRMIMMSLINWPFKYKNEEKERNGDLDKIKNNMMVCDVTEGINDFKEIMCYIFAEINYAIENYPQFVMLEQTVKPTLLHVLITFNRLFLCVSISDCWYSLIITLSQIMKKEIEHQQKKDKGWEIKQCPTNNRMKLSMPIRGLSTYLKNIPFGQEASRARLEQVEIFNFNQNAFSPTFFIKSYNFEEGATNFFVEQEFYQTTLQEINPNILSYPDKIVIMTKIAKIVQYTTSKRICIRTLRPEMLSITRYTDDFDVKVIWMDKAIQFEESRNGTAAYRGDFCNFTAPEIKMGKSHGFQADVWSFGAIFYYLLFGSVSNIKIVKNELKWTYPAGTPTWLSEILDNFLCEDPAQRCQISASLNYLKAMKLCAETAQKTIPQF